MDDAKNSLTNYRLHLQEIYQKSQEDYDKTYTYPQKLDHKLRLKKAKIYPIRLSLWRQTK